MSIPPSQHRIHTLAPDASWDRLRLKDILHERLPWLGSRYLGFVFRNGLVRRGEHCLEDFQRIPGAEGGPIEVDLRQGTHAGAASRRPALIQRMKVVHDDAAVVVVEKAAGICVQPERDETEAASRRHPPLVELLMHYWRSSGAAGVNPVLVQRLDADTSGLLVLGKSVEAGRRLQKLLGEGRVRRIYQAIVQGEVGPEQGVWRSRLGRGITGRRESVGRYQGDADDSKRKSVGGRVSPARPGKTAPGRARKSSGAGDAEIPSTGGHRFYTPPGSKDAVTRFRVLRRFRGLTLLECELETGRTHQIRIHTAEAGHPVLGDDFYTELALRTWKRATEGNLYSPEPTHPYAEILRCVDTAGGAGAVLRPRKAARLCLHAVRLAFPHPFGGQFLEFESPLPADIARHFDSRLESPPSPERRPPSPSRPPSPERRPPSRPPSRPRPRRAK
jgi:23S rRNA pseudouridine1911/1915/1917 synthase